MSSSDQDIPSDLSVSVDHLLLLGVLYCQQQSDSKQVFELWHLINKSLDLKVEAQGVVDLVLNLAEIAIFRSETLLQIN